ncbi:vimentin-type intermediate filament-associated coiled-coil protein [Callorhinchus milii]|uniref:Vimentin-type intermediate filament-associated coiled-coil protein-like protein n=1 Tax=Callorhinchus milii TaxID=7868 RepID=V9L0E3_CALMI|nr:vimentin-type intermediate filament-associated coiled-coil protein [Callorhinchus milii]|eukprot:gi/632966026/ref/XP_007899190.1/ PREDICTED: vimentin-type intermediate filament-associated coiled-coil protein [Callorhinchus milii]
MSVLSSVQIREANAHLAAVHRRVTELERRLEAAERTVREQAERLISKDRELQAAVRELGLRKDREIADLQTKLHDSEGIAQKLQNVIQEKDSVIAQLRHRNQLLDKITRSRPLLDNLLSYMAEAERLQSVHIPHLDTILPEDNELPLLSSTNGSMNISTNDRNFSVSEDDTEEQDQDDAIFGTTV